MAETADARSGMIQAVAGGDEIALRTLVQSLVDEGQRTWAELLDVTDPRFWQRLLQAAARASLTASAANEAAPAADRQLTALGATFTVGRDRPAEPVRRQVLLDGLSSPDSAVRAEAAELLGRRDDEDALPALEQLAGDKNDHVRAAAVRAIGQFAPERATPVLLRALQRYDIVAAEAVNGLIRIGAPAVPLLIDELKRGNPWTRWHAAKALSGTHDPRAIGPLVDALTDEFGSVRWEAVYALSAMGPDVLVPLCDKLVTARITPWLADGADRVLRRVAVGSLHQTVAPLQQALHHLGASVEVPVQADRVRRELRGHG